MARNGVSSQVLRYELGRSLDSTDAIPQMAEWSRGTAGVGLYKGEGSTSQYAELHQVLQYGHTHLGSCSSCK